MSVPVDPYTFTNGTVADATEVNARFNPLYSVLNAGLDATNMDLTANFTWTGAHTFSSGITLSDDTSIAAAKKIYFDGGFDVFAWESTPDTLDFEVGGVRLLRLKETASYDYVEFGTGVSDGVYVGVADSEINAGYDVNALKTLQINKSGYQGGTSQFRDTQILDGKGAGIADFDGTTKNVIFTNELLLGVEDPPTANYGTRQSFSRAWLKYTDGAPGSIADSYNIDSVTDDDGDGIFVINFDTDFASSNYVPIGNSAGTDLIISFSSYNAGDVTLTSYDVSAVGAADASFTVNVMGDQ